MQEAVLAHYAQHGRQLPWRHTRDPYAILISEVMLQQTQVSRVLEYWTSWLQLWPGWEQLAAATPRQVLAAWHGLGYNSRGLRLLTLARAVVEQYGGQLPRDHAALLALPGIGPYTAGAVQAFAWDAPVAVVDTNIRRIFIHFLHIPEDTPARELERIALASIPPQGSRVWYNALMDYGSMVLTARATGIRPTSRQSKFDGSVRQARAAVLRHLTAHPMATMDEIAATVLHPQLPAALAALLRERIILEEKGVYRLAE